MNTWERVEPSYDIQNLAIAGLRGDAWPGAEMDARYVRGSSFGIQHFHFAGSRGDAWPGAETDA